MNGADPYIARALNDPLMVDPDLSHRTDANAAITIGYDHALPSFNASEEAASRARATARLALLEEGPIPELPPAQAGPGPASLAKQYGVEQVLEGVGAPGACRAEIRSGFAYAATMPDTARVMPHGMVRVAARADLPECRLHLVRYQTPASKMDVLQHHYTLIARAGLEPKLFAAPEASITAGHSGAAWRIHAREASGSLTAVDVVMWTLN
ncbi:MAG: hypothetical protein AAFQ90_06500 [Pseudomonadota bacterium]